MEAANLSVRVWVCGAHQGDFGSLQVKGYVATYATPWFNYGSCGPQADTANSWADFYVAPHLLAQRNLHF